MPKPALRLVRAVAIIFALSVTGYLAIREQREVSPKPPAAGEQAVEGPAAVETTANPPASTFSEELPRGVPGGATNPAGTVPPNTTFISTSKFLKLNLPVPPLPSMEEPDAEAHDYYLRSSKSAPINLVPEPEAPASSDPSVDQ